MIPRTTAASLLGPPLVRATPQEVIAVSSPDRSVVRPIGNDWKEL